MMTEFHTRLVNQTVEQIETTDFDRKIISVMGENHNKFKPDKKGILKCLDYVTIDGKTYMIGIARIWHK